MTAHHTRLALGLIVGALIVGDVMRSTLLADAAQLPFNVVLAGTVTLIAVGVGRATLDELGLAPEHVGRGLWIGAMASALVSAVIVVAALVPASRGFFDDERADVGVGSWLFDVLVDIPLGTVVLEELAFRGCLLGLLLRLTSVRLAVLAASVAFGLWHVAPAWTTARDNAALDDVAANVSGLVGIVGGTVLVTSIAGAVFCWLRLRSGSLVAPMMAHYATNAVAFTAAWVLAP